MTNFHQSANVYAMTEQQKPNNLEYPYKELGEQPALMHPEMPTVLTSISAYRPRLDGKTGGYDEDVPRGYEKAAGNMAPLYGQPDMDHLNPRNEELNALEPEAKAAIVAERAEVAKQRAVEFLTSQGIDPNKVFILKPQNQWAKEPDLNPVSADDLPDDRREYWNIETEDGSTTLGPERPGNDDKTDMVYTKDPEKALAILPADCPTLIGRGQDADGNWVMWLQHGGWPGLNAGYLDQGLDFAHDELDDRSRPAGDSVVACRVVAGGSAAVSEPVHDRQCGVGLRSRGAWSEHDAYGDEGRRGTGGGGLEGSR